MRVHGVLLNAREPINFVTLEGLPMNFSINASQDGLPLSRANRVFASLRAIFVLAILGVCVSGCGYNTIPTLEEQAKAKWADVQNQYQRRADLIPNLVATVQGYAKQEKDVLTSVDRSARQGDFGEDRRLAIDRSGKGSSSSRRPSPNCQARSAACLRSAKIIPT